MTMKVEFKIPAKRLESPMLGLVKSVFKINPEYIDTFNNLKIIHRN